MNYYLSTLLLTLLISNQALSANHCKIGVANALTDSQTLQLDSATVVIGSENECYKQCANSASTKNDYKYCWYGTNQKQVVIHTCAKKEAPKSSDLAGATPTITTIYSFNDMYYTGTKYDNIKNFEKDCNTYVSKAVMEPLTAKTVRESKYDATTKVGYLSRYYEKANGTGTAHSYFSNDAASAKCAAIAKKIDKFPQFLIDSTEDDNATVEACKKTLDASQNTCNISATDATSKEVLALASPVLFKEVDAASSASCLTACKNYLNGKKSEVLQKFSSNVTNFDSKVTFTATGMCKWKDGANKSSSSSNTNLVITLSSSKL